MSTVMLIKTYFVIISVIAVHAGDFRTITSVLQKLSYSSMVPSIIDK